MHLIAAVFCGEYANSRREGQNLNILSQKSACLNHIGLLGRRLWAAAENRRPS
jgi:hypothetical protein